MKCIVHDDVVLSDHWRAHCQRTSLRSRSGHVMRVTRPLPGGGRSSSPRVLAAGWDSRLSACTASPQSMLLATCDLT